MSNSTEHKSINDTERRILQAAEREFLTKGLKGARTSAIAEAAGVNHAMLHYYFRTKEKLFERIISEKLDALHQLISRSFIEMNLPLEELIKNLINEHLDFIASNPDLPRFITNEIFGDDERIENFYLKIMRVAPDVMSKLQTKIDDLADAGQCERVEARMLLLDIVSLNVFPFVAAPLMNRIFGGCMDNTADFIEKRKKENFETIVRKLNLRVQTA